MAAILSADRQRGALIGLSIGDVLRATVEFEMSGTFSEVTGYPMRTRARPDTRSSAVFCASVIVGSSKAIARTWSTMVP
jgi:ADP-ribosylglycohydrolase